MRDEPPPKISKLAIAAETEEDRYDIVTSVVCYSCPQKDVDKTSGKLPVVIEGVMNAMTFSKREEVKAWEQEFVPCEHTLCLVQQDIEDPDAKGFQERYYRPTEEPPVSQTPAHDLETQMRKLADGILSGRYSHPDSRVVASPDSPEVPHQKGLAPTMFKYLVGQGHEEFATMRQQDAFEFLLHLFKAVSMSKHPAGLVNPVQHFRFEVEQRLQCLACKKVRYKIDEQDNLSIAVPARRISPSNEMNQFESVTLAECLEIFTAEEIVELSCPGCGSQDGFSKRSSFKSLPQELAVNARRFELVNWVPTKLDIPVLVDDEPLDFGPYLASERDASEELLPDVTESAAFVPDSAILEQLLAMGFPSVRCEKALHATGNCDSDAAMNWLFAHMEDPDIDEPQALGNPSGGFTEPDMAKIAQLGEMGIEAPHARKALAATDGDVNRALDWVFSHPDDAMEDNIEGSGGDDSHHITTGYDTIPARYRLQSIVCHKGTSVHAGHYVAFIRKSFPGQSELSWVLFNDEKVVKYEGIDDMKKTAYMYFFTRV
ncbi:uncharacterized protein PFLUO_LOCUS9198 [Penicillium psychrofluorescens]|uniref:uncharacterized protein n=1 Tax=Penicillium psychrofluorescens TaxID=3158075 RepID=UPI003CCD7369